MLRKIFTLLFSLFVFNMMSASAIKKPVQKELQIGGGNLTFSGAYLGFNGCQYKFQGSNTGYIYYFGSYENYTYELLENHCYTIEYVQGYGEQGQACTYNRLRRLLSPCMY